MCGRSRQKPHCRQRAPGPGSTLARTGYRYTPLTPLYPGGASSARRVSLVINFPPGRAGVGPLSGKKVSQPLSPSRQAETSVNAGPNVLRPRRAGTRRSSRRGMRPILVGHALSLTKVAVSTRRLSAGRGRQGVGGGATNTCRSYPLGCPARTRLSPEPIARCFPPIRFSTSEPPTGPRILATISIRESPLFPNGRGASAGIPLPRRHCESRNRPLKGPQSWNETSL